MSDTVKKKSPLSWVPSLYYAEGIPYAIVMYISVIMYKRLGISNADIALYTSWLYLPWAIKPLWSPIVDILKTKRFWIVTMQLVVGAGMAGVAFTIPVPSFFQYTLAFFWLLAFGSATHDIAADGFYMLGLSKGDQAFYVGIRNTLYRFAMLTGQGLLVILAGYLESTTGPEPLEITFKANPNQAIVQFVNPDSVKTQTFDGELKLVSQTSEVVVNTQKISKIEADSLVAYYKAWNIKNNFYAEEKVIAAEKVGAEQSTWDSMVEPLENFIRDNFGVEKKALSNANMVGNLGVAYFHLSKAPEDDDPVVLNFGRDSGDNSFELIEGTRFVFTKENWNKPAFAVVQIDPKLNFASEASFAGRAGNIPLAWIVTFIFLAVMFVFFAIYHKFMLPYPKEDVSKTAGGDNSVFKEFFNTFKAFFTKKNIGLAIVFLLVYRLGESQLVKLASPFLLDAKEAGGLGLTTGTYGLIYGIYGVFSLLAGGIVGGYLASRNGLKHWLWWMVFAMNLPNAVYVYLSYFQPESHIILSACVAIEQFGYGFGFTAYMLFMIYISDGEHKTAHYALCTGFMALGMMIPGMISGWLQELIGYQHFFIWVLIATVPAFIVSSLIKIDPEFGKKTKEELA